MKKLLFLFGLLCVLPFSEAKAQDPMLGEIRMFAGNFAPRGWALCEGQLLPIAQNSALFSILGTMYGGDGRTTFGLPDLRGRVPMGVGRGPGLSDRRQGIKIGTENETLTLNQIPSHTHSVNGVSTDGNQSSPASHLPAGTKVLDPEYSNEAPNAVMSNRMIGNSGGGQPHNNIQPSTTVRFIIALVGVFPSRS